MSKRLDAVKQSAQKLEKDSWNFFWATVVESSSILKEIEPRSRRPWLALVIQDRLRAQNGKCPLCLETLSPPEWEVDHVIPFSYGGGNEPANLQVVHLKCNRRKGRMVDPWDLLRYLEGRYMNL